VDHSFLKRGSGFPIEGMISSPGGSLFFLKRFRLPY